jgi:hypothetical protein
MDEHAESQIDEVALKLFKPDGSTIDGLHVGGSIPAAASAASAGVRTAASACVRTSASTCCGNASAAPST